MKTNFEYCLPARLFGVIIALLSLALAAHAQNSTWTNKLGGSWGAAANWNSGTIASGSGNTADFSTLALGTSPVVTLDGARSIGNMIFGDQGNAYSWTLNPGSGGPLTLAVSSASPTITVNNQTTTVSAVLAGSAGMTKAGAGILSLAVEEGSLSGVTVVSNGVLRLSANPGDDGNGTLGNSAIMVYGPGELQFNAGDVSGYGNRNALTLIGGTMRQVSAYSETLGRPITLDNGTITANPGAGAYNHPPHLNGDCYNQDGDLIATAANSTNYISMPAGTQFGLRGGSFSNAANSVLIVNGVLDDFATGAFGPQSLVTGGVGSMILNSNNTYTGTTTINGGTLEVDGSTSGSSEVMVNSGGFLSGTGTINGGVTVQIGGTLMAGTLAGMGKLTIGNGLTFNVGSTNVMRINKTGATLSSDLLQGMASVSYGGTLKVTATGNAPAAGDIFTLFNSSSYGGVFTTYNLPALASGLSWDVYQLTVNGTIQVVSGSITSPNITATVSGGVVSLSWPMDDIGWSLQVQTNSLAVGLSTNWVDISNSTMTNQMVLPMNTGNGCIFYRLVYSDYTPIDRYALVTRHNIQWTSPTGQIPLGNGEFCFNADGTGLQTFGGNTMSHWGWHSFPLPAGVTAAQIPATGTFETGRVEGPDNPPAGTGAIETWMTQNPHIMNLGRLQLCNTNGTALTTSEISGLVGTMNLWSGIQTSSYQVNGQPVTVETCVHPALDAVVVRIESPLVASGGLQVSLDFPYPALADNAWVGDFSPTNGNTTTMTMDGGSRADFARALDTTNYDVGLAWSPDGEILAAGSTLPNRFLLSAPGTNCLEFICVFSNAPVSVALPTVEQSLVDTSNHWVNFWGTGGAIDLSGSEDSRWFELERRIVLSQYELAAQDAGSWPESENGLMGIDPWVGQFHMEMLWWHLAHYALWNRWSMLTNALPYQRFIPGAQALAEQLDYAGLKWQKEVGPEGRTAPWIYSQVLLWKEPHPIFFAELDYRLHPTLATLENWTNIVFGTADNMASYPDLTNNGIYSLAYDMPPSEKALWSDTVFDLAYWRWGLNQAQVWRQRLGLARNPLWDLVLTNLAPMPVLNGVFVDYAGDTTTYTTTAWGHPDPIGVYGMLPPIEGVDTNIAHSTVIELWNTWDWNNSNGWGWDFPWMAMAAARTGETEIAIDALMDDSPQNQYDNRGVCNGWYLPGNGGLLYAVAMMAAGWDGSSGWAPGFPNDGSWTVKWEGLNQAP